MCANSLHFNSTQLIHWPRIWLNQSFSDKIIYSSKEYVGHKMKINNITANMFGYLLYRIWCVYVCASSTFGSKFHATEFLLHFTSNPDWSSPINSFITLLIRLFVLHSTWWICKRNQRNRLPNIAAQQMINAVRSFFLVYISRSPHITNIYYNMSAMQKKNDLYVCFGEISSILFHLKKIRSVKRNLWYITVIIFHFVWHSGLRFTSIFNAHLLWDAVIQ